MVDDHSKPVSVATGNWGCGAFRGDPQLKSLIQIMAASVCNRDLVYYTFDDRKLCEAIYDIYLYLTERSVTVGQLYDMLLRYAKLVETPNYRLSLFDFLYAEFESYNVDTESEGESGKKSKPETSSKPAKRKLATEQSKEKPKSPVHTKTDEKQKPQGAISKQPSNFQKNYNLTFDDKKAFEVQSSDFPGLGEQTQKFKNKPELNFEPKQGPKFEIKPEHESKADELYSDKNPQSPSRPSETQKPALTYASAASKKLNKNGTPLITECFPKLPN